MLHFVNRLKFRVFNRHCIVSRLLCGVYKPLDLLLPLLFVILFKCKYVDVFVKSSYKYITIYMEEINNQLISHHRKFFCSQNYPRNNKILGHIFFVPIYVVPTMKLKIMLFSTWAARLSSDLHPARDAC